jgi:hypothetical protein
LTCVNVARRRDEIHDFLDLRFMIEAIPAS